MSCAVYVSSDDALAFLDLNYALRLCTKAGNDRAAVYIYKAMGLYEDAADLALKVSYELAEEVVEALDDDEDESLQRRLWLKIAKHVVQHNDIQHAMSVLRETDARKFLKMEDILPFFPDFSQIKDFRPEICQSLEEHNQKIDEVNTEITQSTESAEQIRQDIDELRNRHVLLGKNQKCEICGFSVLLRQLYGFQCRHVFHADCLSKLVTKHFTPKQRSQFGNLQARLRKRSTKGEYEQLLTEYDELIASDCPLCGDLMIRLVEKPFVVKGEDDAQVDSWDIP